MLARDVRTEHGQVDLVLREGQDLVCAEVKTSGTGCLEELSSARFRPGRRCDRRRLARQRRVCRALAERYGGRARVDLIEVWIERGSGRWSGCLHRDLRAPLAA